MAVVQLKTPSAFGKIKNSSQHSGRSERRAFERKDDIKEFQHS